jgi:hypothetical protein
MNATSHLPPLITAAQYLELIANSIAALKGDKNLTPAVKLYTPDDCRTWLLTQISLDDANAAYGLIDLGDGSPTLDRIDLAELTAFRGPKGSPVTQDTHFCATQTIVEYLAEAFEFGTVMA